MLNSLQCWCCGGEIPQLFLIETTHPLCTECTAEHELLMAEVAA